MIMMMINLKKSNLLHVFNINMANFEPIPLKNEYTVPLSYMVICYRFGISSFLKYPRII